MMLTYPRAPSKRREMSAPVLEMWGLGLVAQWGSVLMIWQAIELTVEIQGVSIDRRKRCTFAGSIRHTLDTINTVAVLQIWALIWARWLDLRRIRGPCRRVQRATDLTSRYGSECNCPCPGNMQWTLGASRLDTSHSR